MGLLPFKDEAKDIGYEVNPKHESFRKYSKNLDQNANRISQQRMSIVANLSPQQQTTIKEENSENEISKSSEFDINNSYTSYLIHSGIEITKIKLYNTKKWKL